MDSLQKNRLIIATLIELGKRTLNKSVGNDLSTKFVSSDTVVDAEGLVSTRIREKINIKVG
jgi:hypothetical protein